MHSTAPMDCAILVLDNNDRILYILQSYRTRASPSNELESYPGYTWCGGFLPVHRDAVSVFYSPRRISQGRDGFMPSLMILAQIGMSVPFLLTITSYCTCASYGIASIKLFASIKWLESVTSVRSSSYTATFHPSRKLLKLDELDTWDTAGDVVTSSWVMNSRGLLHMDEQRRDGQFEPTYSSSVPIWDVALRIWRKQWTTGRCGERRSVITVLIAWHDDEDDDIRSIFIWCNLIYLFPFLFLSFPFFLSILFLLFNPLFLLPSRLGNSEYTDSFSAEG